MNVKSVCGSARLRLFAQAATVAVFASLTQPQGASAQEAPGQTAAEDEETVVVIGSRIRRQYDHTALPVTVISREDIDASGETRVSDVVRQSTFNSFGSTSPEGSAGGTNLSLSTINLRGLGFGRTLVLVNGRRLAQSGTFFGFDPDVNFIPSTAIESVQILPNDGSAIYGGDALGGVVDFRLRENFDGLQVRAQHRYAERGASDYTLGAIAGKRFDRGNIVISPEWSQTGRTPVSDIPALQPGADLGLGYTSNGVPPTFRILDAFGDGTNVTSPNIAPQSCSTSQVRSLPGSTILNPITSDSITYANATECRTDNTSHTDATSPGDRYSLWAHADYDILTNVNLYGELILSRQESRAVRTAPEVSGLTMSAANPNNPTASATPSNPAFGVTGPRAVSFALAPLQGLYELTSDQVLFTTGLTWMTDLGRFDVYYHSAHGEDDGRTLNTVSVSGIQGLINSGALNPFGTVQSSVAEAASAVASSHMRHSEGAIYQAGASLTGDLNTITLPGGAVQYAVGYEYRRLTLFETESGNGFTSGYNAGFVSRIDEEQTVQAGFGEIMLPVLQNVELSWAGRYETADRPDFGELVNRAAVLWRATDQLDLRFSYNEGIRSPNLFQLSSATSTGTFTGVDAHRCTQAGNNPSDPRCQPVTFSYVSAGGSVIEPETTTNFNWGFTWSPTNRIRLSADYYQLRLESLASTLSVPQVLQLEASGQDVTKFGLAVNRDASGDIVSVLAGAATVPGADVDGIDVDASFSADISPSLTWHSRMVLSYLLRYDRTIAPGSPELSALEQRSNGNFNGGPTYRAAWQNDFSSGDFTVNTALNIIDGYDGRTPEQVHSGVAPLGKVDSFVTADLSLTWRTPWDSAFFIGVQNLFDETPSSSRAIWGNAGYDQSNSDFSGRIYSVRLIHNF